MTTLDSTTAVPKRQFDVRARDIFGRKLLMRVHVTMETNDVGLFIWAQCDGTRTVDQIGAAVVTTFGVDPATAAADVTQFLDSLTAAQFISWEQT